MTPQKKAEPVYETEAETPGPALPHSIKPVLMVCGLFALLWLVASAGVVSTWEQVRQYCEIPVSVGTVPQHIESALIRKIPVGSSRREVQAYLGRRGLGTDGNSVCSPGDGESSVTCRIPSHHHSWELIRETYTISFEFDANQRLGNIHVQSWLTYL